MVLKVIIIGVADSSCDSYANYLASMVVTINPTTIPILVDADFPSFITNLNSFIEHYVPENDHTATCSIHTYKGFDDSWLVA